MCCFIKGYWSFMSSTQTGVGVSMLMVLWFYGFIVYGFVVLEFYGFIVLLLYGCMVVRFYGFLVYGFMALWLYSFKVVITVSWFLGFKNVTCPFHVLRKILIPCPRFPRSY